MELRKRGSCEDICAGKHSACFRACIGIEACEPCRQAMAACVHECPSRKRNLFSMDFALCLTLDILASIVNAFFSVHDLKIRNLDR